MRATPATKGAKVRSSGRKRAMMMVLPPWDSKYEWVLLKAARLKRREFSQRNTLGPMLWPIQ